MKLLLLVDATSVVWQERLRTKERAAAVWCVGEHHCWERVRVACVAESDPWSQPASWDVCVAIQSQRRQDILPFMLHTAPAIPMILITPWVTAAQTLMPSQPWLKVICAACHMTQPNALSGLLALMSEVRSGVAVIGEEPTRSSRRRRESRRRRYVYGA